VAACPERRATHYECPGHCRTFKEVKQNWFGFTVLGNGGSGLGPDFAVALYDSLGTILSNFGSEDITASSHLEKLGLDRPGVGRDRISDFTTNLIKEYLLEYTQTFARKYWSSSSTERSRYAGPASTTRPKHGRPATTTCRCCGATSSC